MENKVNILVVEDDPNLGSLLNQYLQAKGFETVWCKDGQEGYDEYKKNRYDLLLLDVMMPLKDGFTLAEEIRATDKDVPIIFLTAKSLKEDLLKGFEVGADDYLTKPFTMEVLLARIQAVLRRTTPQTEQHKGPFSIGDYTFDYDHQNLEKNGESRHLTTKENELLYLLCTNANNVLERQAALKYVWGDDNYFNGRSMDVYIAKLRKYLKGDDKVQIVNVHGKGFKLLVD